MTNYDTPDRDSGPYEEDAGGLGGLSLQTGASILLIAVIAAVLWLFFGPLPSTDEVLPTATATTAAVSRTTGSPAARAETPPARTGTQAGPTQGETTVGTSTPTSATAGTPAPAVASLGDGGFVAVTGTDGFGIRYRFGPGTNYATIRIVDEGEVLRVDGEPEEAEGRTWYRLQDAQGNVGWAVAEFLQPTSAPATWNPPAASPTPPVGSQEGETATPEL